jgi:hypothetical protein
VLTSLLPPPLSLPPEPFSFGGLYGTQSKYGHCDITGDGAMEFFSNSIKVTSKWMASYSGVTGGVGAADSNKRKSEHLYAYEDKASFDGKM